MRWQNTRQFHLSIRLGPGPDDVAYPTIVVEQDLELDLATLHLVRGHRSPLSTPRRGAITLVKAQPDVLLLHAFRYVPPRASGMARRRLDDRTTTPRRATGRRRLMPQPGERPTELAAKRYL
jgi:hypothetical protein